MLTTSTRILRLLSLLQTRADWTGPQLAERLGVSGRTVRNDVERLRRLGYPVDAAPGVAGGYRLGSGAALPPLLLDDDEAVAVAVGLRMAATGGIEGIEDASLRALTNLEQVLPSRLRPRVSALHEATLSLPGAEPAVDADVLSTIAAAVRSRERLRFTSDDGEGPGQRTVEPQRLVHTRGRWYLVAWDPAPGGWTSVRADRITLSSHRGPRFERREDPEGDLAAWLERIVGQEMWAYRARLRVHAPAEQVLARVPPAVVVEAIDEASCFVNVGSDTPRDLAFWVAMIDEDFDTGEHEELAEALRELAARYVRAADGWPPAARG